MVVHHLAEIFKDPRPGLQCVGKFDIRTEASYGRERFVEITPALSIARKLGDGVSHCYSLNRLGLPQVLRAARLQNKWTMGEAADRIGHEMEKRGLEGRCSKTTIHSMESRKFEPCLPWLLCYSAAYRLAPSSLFLMAEAASKVKLSSMDTNLATCEVSVEGSAVQLVELLRPVVSFISHHPVNQRSILPEHVRHDIMAQLYGGLLILHRRETARSLDAQREMFRELTGNRSFSKSYLAGLSYGREMMTLSKMAIFALSRDVPISQLFLEVERIGYEPMLLNEDPTGTVSRLLHDLGVKDRIVLLDIADRLRKNELSAETLEALIKRTLSR